MKYYINDNNGNLVGITDGCETYVLRANETAWEKLPRDNSYIREVLGGQGNNCLTMLTDEETMKIIQERCK